MRPPSGLTIGHGVVGHWKNSNCIRPMSKRISKALGRALSPKGPICECNGNAKAYSFTADALERRPCPRRRAVTLGRDLSPKGPHANEMPMQVLILPNGRLGKASLPRMPEMACSTWNLLIPVYAKKP
jgi:hypothetical protein